LTSSENKLFMEKKILMKDLNRGWKRHIPIPSLIPSEKRDMEYWMHPKQSFGLVSD
jgi:hypothetical protein